MLQVEPLWGRCHGYPKSVNAQALVWWAKLTTDGAVLTVPPLDKGAVNLL